MNCHETRERLSGLLDDALDALERAEVGAHLEGCPDCRRELERLRATVSLLSRVEHPRAPVGFVDRVMAAAHPFPWYRRLGRRLFLPLNIKLPVQAAAMLVIAVLGVYLLQRTPELRDTARLERETPASRSKPLGTTTTVPTPPQASSEKDSKAGKVDSGKFSEPAPRASRESEDTVRDGRRLDSPQSSPPFDAAEGQSGALAPEPPPMAAKRQSAPSSVLGRLNVKSRPAAEQGLADLLARLGGTETGRRREVGATVVEVLVPEARFADFVRGLTTLGTWTPEGQPAALPTDPSQIRLSIRISE